MIELGITANVARIVGMLAAIRFNDQLVLESDEINNPGADRNLPAKFDVRQLTCAEKAPKRLFCLG